MIPTAISFGVFMGLLTAYQVMVFLQLRDVVKHLNKTTEDIETMRNCSNLNFMNVHQAMNKVQAQVQNTNQAVEDLKLDSKYVQ